MKIKELFNKKKSDEPIVEDKVEEPKKVSQTYYQLGLTDDNRVSFSMGYSSITMNRAGIDTLIDLLKTFQEKIPADEVENSKD